VIKQEINVPVGDEGISNDTLMAFEVVPDDGAVDEQGKAAR
jgi:hypothetical protein